VTWKKNANNDCPHYRRKRKWWEWLLEWLLDWLLDYGEDNLDGHIKHRGRVPDYPDIPPPPLRPRRCEFCKWWAVSPTDILGEVGKTGICHHAKKMDWSDYCANFEQKETR